MRWKKSEQKEQLLVITASKLLVIDVMEGRILAHVTGQFSAAEWGHPLPSPLSLGHSEQTDGRNNLEDYVFVAEETKKRTLDLYFLGHFDGGEREVLGGGENFTHCKSYALNSLPESCTIHHLNAFNVHYESSNTCPCVLVGYVWEEEGGEGEREGESIATPPASVLASACVLHIHDTDRVVLNHFSSPDHQCLPAKDGIEMRGHRFFSLYIEIMGIVILFSNVTNESQFFWCYEAEDEEGNGFRWSTCVPTEGDENKYLLPYNDQSITVPIGVGMVYSSKELYSNIEESSVPVSYRAPVVAGNHLDN